ncbi:uncharacterized protein LOC135927413 isoform X2 [Gordionus sp. m RMFG-2023]|uniref:uncharacterized protein LOC135927413 isoform X2 n=2 Tax=Gordionus sp. m RMFG-2023 TaxID=3053472 RepID=UPI0031FC8C3F
MNKKSAKLSHMAKNEIKRHKILQMDHNYWQLPRLKLNMFMELDKLLSNPNHLNFENILWYCNKCHHVKPITMQNIFNFLHMFIPMEPIFIKDQIKYLQMNWCDIINVRRLSQVIVIAIEIDISIPKEEISNGALKIGIKMQPDKTNGCKISQDLKNKELDESECGVIEMDTPSIYFDFKNYLTNINDFNNKKSIDEEFNANSLFIKHFPELTNALTHKTTHKRFKGGKNNTQNIRSLMDETIILPFLPPHGGLIQIENQLRQLHKRITSRSQTATLTRNHLIPDKMLTNEKSAFIAINEFQDSGLNIPHPSTSHLDQFPRLRLLATKELLNRDGFPVGPRDEKNSPHRNFIYSMPDGIYPALRSDIPLLAIDCEMCVTYTHNNKEDDKCLIRVSAVDETLTPVYDQLVKPDGPVKDYLTAWSGLTEDDLIDVTITLKDVQRDIAKMIQRDKRGAIICGHSLNFDLLALKMFHPYVIDTSIIYNIRGDSHFKKSKLKTLAKIFLGKEIQNADKIGHDSIEDARTVMELVLLKLRTGQDFGDITRRYHFKYDQNTELLMSKIDISPNSALGSNSFKLYCPKCFPALRLVADQARDMQLITSSYANQKNAKMRLDEAISDDNAISDCESCLVNHKNSISRQKDKSWQILSLTSSSQNIDDEPPVVSDSTKRLNSNFLKFSDPISLLTYQKLHSLDKYVTFTNLRIPVNTENYENMDLTLKDLYTSSPSNTLFIPIVWLTSQQHKNQIKSTSTVTSLDIGSLWMKIKR